MINFDSFGGPRISSDEFKSDEKNTDMGNNSSSNKVTEEAIRDIVSDTFGDLSKALDNFHPNEAIEKEFAANEEILDRLTNR
ncbi:MAG: hypothetical protein H0W88_10765 [Parachlamydiaceae bacterium]|nr:hypothetical protein [Parachlamydiaceae bacterium]